MDRRWCADRALWRGDNETAASRFAFDLNWSAALVGHSLKRNEAVTLPALGTRGILAVHPHAQHAHLEMRPRLNCCAVPARFDCVGVRADIAKCRVRHPVDELSRCFRDGSSGAQARNENTDARYTGQGANEQRQRRRACASIALGHVFPPRQVLTLHPKDQDTPRYLRFKGKVKLDPIYGLVVPAT